MTNSVSEQPNAVLWRVSMLLGDTHPGCKADTYCIDKVFISSQLWGHNAYIILRWHTAESCHPGWQLCCFYKTRLPFHLMPLPWYINARGWLACLWKACSRIIVVVWWEEEDISCSQVTVVLGGCLSLSKHPGRAAAIIVETTTAIFQHYNHQFANDF